MGKRKKHKRHIPNIANDQDIFNAFMEKPRPEDSSSGPLPENALKNRHGLPVIKEDISSIFGIGKDLPSSDENTFASVPEKKSPPPISSGTGNQVPLKKRLKRYPPVESQLDLHGFTALGAELKARTFIQSRFQQGYFTLRIIVGKGLHSETGPVLPHVIEDLLTEMKKQGTVLAFSWDRKKKSDSGAVLVYLNQFGDEPS
ncbi:MAG: hypothetical protein CSB28_00165 [Desulfobacterales bacterium]|nr:MAG: hypothetical protein CSB28_00165 [Desulfobacterales bacterium]